MAINDKVTPSDNKVDCPYSDQELTASLTQYEVVNSFSSEEYSWHVKLYTIYG